MFCLFHSTVILFKTWNAFLSLHLLYISFPLLSRPASIARSIQRATYMLSIGITFPFYKCSIYWHIPHLIGRIETCYVFYTQALHGCRMRSGCSANTEVLSRNADSRCSLSGNQPLKAAAVTTTVFAFDIFTTFPPWLLYFNPLESQTRWVPCLLHYSHTLR